MTEYESLETDRVEFTNASDVVVEITSPITFNTEYYLAPKIQRNRIVASVSIMAFLFLIVLCGVWCIFMFKLWACYIVPGYFLGRGATAAAVLNSVQIIVLANVWNMVANRLNDYETHQTDTAYEDAMIVKTSMFQFVNHYIALFYIAFVKGKYPIIPGVNRVDVCLYGGNCSLELAHQLGTIFITQMVVGNMTEVVVPMLKQKWARHKDQQAAMALKAGKEEYSPLENPEGAGDGSLPASPADEVPDELSLAEKSFELDDYGMLELIDDYLEIVVQFGYVTLFVVAFPLAPFLALLSNQLEQMVDMTKMLSNARRPFPRGASDIGTWEYILVSMGNVAVLTNGAFIVFTSHLASHIASTNRVWIFVGIEHLIFFFKFMCDVFIEDSPEDVDRQLARQDYVRKVLLEDLDEEDDLAAGGGDGGYEENAPVATILMSDFEEDTPDAQAESKI